MSEKHELKESPNYHDVIPATARIIKITNIQNPYIMRAREIEQYVESVDRINRELLKFTKTNELLTKKNDAECPKFGDEILIQSCDLKNGIDLPSYFCRGIISHIEEEHTKYNILLVDHGNSIKLSRDDFHIVPRNFISEKYLTKTIGVYNILPIDMKKNTLNEYTAVVVEKWNDDAVQFTKDLLIASKTVYFDHLVTDENGREYGEFYLVIDDIVIRLSEALVITYYATYLEGELLQLIENGLDDVKIVEEDITFSAKFSANKQNYQSDAIQTINKTNRYNPTKYNEKVLIYSTIRFGVLNNINDLRFPVGVHKGWDAYIKSSRSRKLQSYIWPSIKKGLNTVAIGPSQSGKTTGCIMAVCGLLAMHQNELLVGANRPLALILCASSFEVINIQSLCLAFLENHNNIKSVAAFNGKREISIAAAIYNGCQILVATPRYLARFLNNNKSLLSFDRLSYLVLDNADVILDKYYNALGELFKKYQIIGNREPHGDNRPLLQMIISAKHWTANIKKFVSLLMYNPYICITSFIEAVIFRSIYPKLYITKSTHKNQKILDILKDNYNVLRTMIICINAEEAEELSVFLQSTMTRTMLTHEKMKLSDLQVLQEGWKTCIYGLYPVLICTDAVLSELNFTNIQWLIHHSVSLKLKNQFNYRFSTILDSLIQDAANCKISIIIDENNDVQFPSIIRMIKRMRVVIPPNLLENIERIAVTLEKNKKDYDICDNVKSLGFCPEQNICIFRHCVLSEIDTPTTNIQINDQVKLMVMYVHNTTHLSARIIEHLPYSTDSEKIKFSSEEYIQITFKLQEFYQNIENRKVCTSTNVGDICVLEESLDTFKRVQIRHVKYVKVLFENVKFVDVRCIDSGVIHEKIDVRKLLYIPEKLLNLPTHTVEVFLADIEPCDEEYIWNRCSNETVFEWFTKNFDEKSYVIGKVRLHLGNTLWLDDIKIGTKLINNSELIVSSLKKELIVKNHGVSSDNHISNLLQLCKISGLTKINGHEISSLCK